MRGERTADLVESLGMKRPFVSGCPSILGHAIPDVHASSLIATPKVIYHGDEWIYKYHVPRQSLFIDQTSLFELAFSAKRIERLKYIRFYLNDNMMNMKKLDGNYVIPQNLAVWSTLVRSADIVLGTRMHGTIMALLSGTPALLFYHDERTRELAEFRGLPCLDASCIKNSDHALQVAIEEINRVGFGKFKNRSQAAKDRFSLWSLKK